MRATWEICKWEILRHLRNKQFIIGLLITPLIIAFFAGLPQLITRMDRPQQVTYYVVDNVGVIEDLQYAAQGSNIEFLRYQGERDNINELVLTEDASGYFVLEQTFIETGELEVYSDESIITLSNLQNALNNLLQQLRIEEAGINQDLLSYLTAPVQLVHVQLADEEGQQFGQIVVSGALAGILLFLIFSSGSMLLQSAIQEKRDKMAEIILSSINSDNLMQGKIIGHFILGIFQLIVWFAIGLPVLWYFLNVPVFELISAPQLPVLLFFALTGYLLFAALFVGIGATMMDVQSASNIQGMVFMLPILPVVLIGPVIANPNGTVAQIGTFFPLTSSAITILRVGLTNVPTWELVTGGAILIISTILIMKASAKIFRVGMLMYGKSASVKEMWKWIRY